MVHFTLSKFKKAGQLAFLAGFIFVLPSCGGGGGGGGGNPPPPDPVTYTYKTFSQYSSEEQAFYDACEASPSTCSLSAYYDTLAENLVNIDFFMSAQHLRFNDAANWCSFKSTSASFNMTVNSSKTDTVETYIFGPQKGKDRCSDSHEGADVSGSPMSLETDNYVVTPDFDFPGALTGLLVFDYEYWGITDSNLNETVFISTTIFQKNNSGSFWSGNQYVIGNIADFNYGTSCNYLSNPRRCNSFLSDQTLDTDLVAHHTGVKTFSGDMPSSGSASYKTFSMSKGIYGVTNFMNFNLGGSFITTDCSQSNPRHGFCHAIVIDSISSEHILAVDYAAKTISGTISMKNHYVEEGYNDLDLIVSSSYDAFKATLNDFSISATITGTSFSGTVSNSHYQGDITGYFYGPQAKEIAAIIRFDTENKTESLFQSSGAFGIISINGSK